MSTKISYTHFLRTDEEKRLTLDYALMDAQELLYNFYQPDCLNCHSYDCLPIWCPECGVSRQVGGNGVKDSPLIRELKCRKLFRKLDWHA